MRIHAGAIALLLLLGLSFGCRSALSPNLNRNRAPETWITAAPQDTITVRDRGNVATPPKPKTIPFRFRMYWAGSDIDGEVVGFYWAVVETLPLPPEGSNLPAALPG